MNASRPRWSPSSAPPTASGSAPSSLLERKTGVNALVAAVDRREWLPLLGALERYARAEGCKAMRIFGRRGWERLLPDYKPARVLLEKELQ